MVSKETWYEIFQLYLESSSKSIRCPDCGNEDLDFFQHIANRATGVNYIFVMALCPKCGIREEIFTTFNKVADEEE